MASPAHNGWTIYNSIQFNSFIVSTVDIQRKALLWQGIQVSIKQWQICTVHLTKYRYMYRERYNGRYIYIHIRIHVYIHTYTDTHIHTYAYTLTYIYIHTHRRWIISVFDPRSIMNRLYWHDQQVGYVCFVPFVWEQRGVIAAVADQTAMISHLLPMCWATRRRSWGHVMMWARFGSQGSIALNWHSRYSGTRYSGTWLYMHTHSSWTGQTLIMAVVRQETSKWLK